MVWRLLIVERNTEARPLLEQLSMGLSGWFTKTAAQGQQWRNSVEILRSQPLKCPEGKPPVVVRVVTSRDPFGDDGQTSLAAQGGEAGSRRRA